MLPVHSPVHHLTAIVWPVACAARAGDKKVVMSAIGSYHRPSSPDRRGVPRSVN